MSKVNQNQISSKIAADESDKELEANISDDENHISQRVPESNVRTFNQLGGKSYVTEEAEPVPKNPVTKLARNQNSASPGSRIVPAKPSTTATEQNGINNPGKAYSNKTKSSKLNINDPESLKKLIYSKSAKKAAEEYLQATKKKFNDQTTKEPNQRSTSSADKNEKSSPYGYNTAASPEKNEKPEDSKVEYDSAYTELSKKLYLQRLHQQSNARDTHMGQIPNYGLLLSPYAAKEIDNRRNIASKELQEAIAARLLKRGEDLDERSKALINYYLEKEFEECTFNPKITPYGDFENKRSPEQFLEDQKKFLQMIELKKQKRKEKIVAEQKLSEGTYKPELCKKSLKILEKKKKLTASADEDVHSRLYKINKNAQQKQMLDIAHNEDGDVADANTSSQFIGERSRNTQKSLENGDKNATFKPSISKKAKEIKREIKIDAILYNDAMRRQRKSIEYSKKLNQKKPSNHNISEESRRAFATRFIREFDFAIAETLEEDQEQKMDYIQLNEFLKKLSFLKDAENVQKPHFTPERILLYDMWYTLYADKYKGVHRRNLLVFLLAVLGLHIEITKIRKSEPNQNNNDDDNAQKADSEGKSGSKREIVGPPEEEGVPPRERRIVGNFDDEENLELLSENVDKIHKIYNLWFVNRLGAKDNLAQISASKKYEEPSYQPMINENSKNIAHLHRERILEGTSELIQQNKIPAPKDGKLTHADLLVLSKKVVNEKIEKVKASLEGNELRYCTFRPVTNDYSKGLKKKDSQTDEGDEEGRGSTLGRDRNSELYALRKITKDKKDKDRFEIEYEKNCDECTFQPNTKLNKPKKSDSEPATIMAKNIEKTIQRLRYGNEIREQKNLWNLRGFYPQLHEAGLSFALEKDSKFKQSSQRSSLKGSTKKSTRPASIGQSLWDKQGSHIDARPYSPSGKQDDQYDPENQIEHRHIDDDGHEIVGNHGDEMHIGNGYNDEQEQEQEVGENERVPLLFVDVNLGQGKSERITVFEGDKSEILARKFAEEHGLDEIMMGKLKELLDSQIAGLLTRIDEELNSLQSETDKNEQQGHIEVYRQDDQIHEEEDQSDESGQ